MPIVKVTSLLHSITDRKLEDSAKHLNICLNLSICLSPIKVRQMGKCFDKTGQTTEFGPRYDAELGELNRGLFC